MKKFALILYLFVVCSWPWEYGAGTESQDSSTGKSPAASSKKMEEQAKPGKEAVVQEHGKKKNSKEKEDCGCDTTLFGEPVPLPVQKPAQGKANTPAGKQSAKSKGKNIEGSKTTSKADLKETGVQNLEKQHGPSGNANQSKELTAQPSEK
jgi:hypothetical protein